MEQHKVFTQLITYSVNNITILQLSSSVPCSIQFTIPPKFQLEIPPEKDAPTAMLDMLCKAHMIVPYYHIFDGRDKQYDMKYERRTGGSPHTITLPASGCTPFFVVRGKGTRDLVFTVSRPTERHDFYYEPEPNVAKELGARDDIFPGMFYRFLEMGVEEDAK